MSERTHRPRSIGRRPRVGFRARQRARDTPSLRRIRMIGSQASGDSKPLFILDRIKLRNRNAVVCVRNLANLSPLGLQKGWVSHLLSLEPSSQQQRRQFGASLSVRALFETLSSNIALCDVTEGAFSSSTPPASGTKRKGRRVHVKPKVPKSVPNALSFRGRLSSFRLSHRSSNEQERVPRYVEFVALESRARQSNMAHRPAKILVPFLVFHFAS